MDNALLLAGALLACALVVFFTLGPLGMLLGGALLLAALASAGIWLLHQVMGHHEKKHSA